MANIVQEKTGKILVLIPAFNEEEQIASVVQRVKREMPAAAVLVVNDGSADETEMRARAAGARVLCHPFNMGYGVALQTGYKYALQNGFDYVLQMDGDGQHDCRYILALVEKVSSGTADVAVGSRFLGEQGYRIPIFRRLGMRLFGWMAGGLIGLKITDPTSGFKVLNRRALEVCIRDIFPGDYPDADVRVLLHRAGLRTCEVPVAMHANAHGRSMHSGLKPLYYAYKMLLTLALNMVRK